MTEHVTLTFLRYRDDGRVTFAGAHQDLLVLRRASSTRSTASATMAEQHDDVTLVVLRHEAHPG